ncbi:MAG: DUF2793 domain-containing protein [Alphaproteobacteria bacterium]|nr:MAG: DUF2793 domain-containing protein [Alphaproteobacteria bacterium]
MAESTPRFSLPLILPGQAQKELFHNEALALLDAAVHCEVEGVASGDPPPEPVVGQCWIVGPGAAGAWAERDDAIAMWTESGWRFVVPPRGMTARDRDSGMDRRFDGTGWSDGAVQGSRFEVDGVKVVGNRQPSVASPSGGTIIDVEARLAIDALIEALMQHGLTD